MDFVPDTVVGGRRDGGSCEIVEPSTVGTVGLMVGFEDGDNDGNCVGNCDGTAVGLDEA